MIVFEAEEGYSYCIIAYLNIIHLLCTHKVVNNKYLALNIFTNSFDLSDYEQTRRGGKGIQIFH